MKKQRLTVISFSLILLALLGGLILCSGEESLAAEPGNELSLGSRGEEVGMIQKSLAGAEDIDSKLPGNQIKFVCGRHIWANFAGSYGNWAK
jgi:hypothetical protein